MAGIVDAGRTNLAENFSANVGGGISAAKGNERFTLEETPDLCGKVAVVTGGSEVRFLLTIALLCSLLN